MKRGRDEYADRPGNARPTPERLRRGAWRIGETIEAGIRYARDEASDPLSGAYHAGHITPAQWDAAEAYAELRERVWGMPGARSCLDTTPVGHDEGDGDPQAEGALRVVSMHLDARGFIVRREVEAVCWQREAIGNMDALRDGLDVLVGYFGTG